MEPYGAMETDRYFRFRGKSSRGLGHALACGVLRIRAHLRFKLETATPLCCRTSPTLPLRSKTAHRKREVLHNPLRLPGCRIMSSLYGGLKAVWAALATLQKLSSDYNDVLARSGASPGLPVRHTYSALLGR